MPSLPLQTSNTVQSKLFRDWGLSEQQEQEASSKPGVAEFTENWQLPQALTVPATVYETLRNAGVARAWLLLHKGMCRDMKRVINASVLLVAKGTCDLSMGQVQPYIHNVKGIGSLREGRRSMAVGATVQCRCVTVGGLGMRFLRPPHQSRHAGRTASSLCRLADLGFVTWV